MCISIYIWESWGNRWFIWDVLDLFKIGVRFIDSLIIFILGRCFIILCVFSIAIIAFWCLSQSWYEKLSISVIWSGLNHIICMLHLLRFLFLVCLWIQWWEEEQILNIFSTKWKDTMFGIGVYRSECLYQIKLTLTFIAYDSDFRYNMLNVIHNQLNL